MNVWWLVQQAEMQNKVCVPVFKVRRNRKPNVGCSQSLALMLCSRQAQQVACNDHRFVDFDFSQKHQFAEFGNDATKAETEQKE